MESVRQKSEENLKLGDQTMESVGQKSEDNL